MSHCSQCGRYIGPYEACPYCGARVNGRVSVRAVKRAAVVLAIAGLFVLWLTATHSPLPQIPIGQIGATANMAYARVEGWVVRGPHYYPDSGYLSFTVADETGEIRVTAYRKESDALRAEERVPALGDRVSVAGTVQVREGGMALTINVPEHVEVIRPEPTERTLGSLTSSDRLLRVRVRGQVWTVRQPHTGLTLITLRDPTGALDVVVDRDLEALTGGLVPPAPGESVEVVGTVDLYQSTPQIVPLSVLDIIPLPEPVEVASLFPIGELRSDNAGQMVAVEGEVAQVEGFSSGVKLTLEDGTGEVTVLLWQDLVQGLGDPAALAVGARLRVVGELALYRGRLEVVPGRPMDVEVLARAAGVGEDAPQMTIGELEADRAGEVVTVEGAVIDIESFAGGFRFALEDGTGQVALVLPLAVYDGLADPAVLNLGSWVRATGLVGVYQDQLQVVPASGDAVEVLAPGEVVASWREIGSLSPTDEGARVAVKGAVVRVEPFSSGRRVWLEDGTGRVMLLLWENVYRRIAQRERLVPGAWMEACGVVQVYRGELEVVPQLPHDVRMVRP